MNDDAGHRVNPTGHAIDVASGEGAQSRPSRKALRALASSSALLSTARDRSEVHKTKHLQGVCDLTLLAPFKPGLIESLDSRTYESRARLLMRTLHALRVSSREYSPLRPFVDTAARIRTIHSLRLAIMDHKLLLAVTFDRPWEPYIRSIWDDVGALLDVIFCNCQDYPLATQSSFEDYMRWVRSVQVETNFFFSTSPMTVDDLQYLKQVELIHRDGQENCPLRAAQETLKDPVQLAVDVLHVPAHQPEIIKQGMLALSALYRLADVYTPRDDGDVLLRAAHELLHGLPTQLPAEVRARFAPQLHWFEQTLPPPRRPQLTTVEVAIKEVQAGILTELRDTHSALLLFAIDDALAAARSLDELRSKVTTQAKADRGLNLNIAFTYQGLCQLGLRANELDKFAIEFREGMEVRAGLLGDLRCNHPRNWQLPQRNWPAAPPADSPMPRIEMSMVHVVIRLGIESAVNEHGIQDPRHPLYVHVTALAGRARGLTLLAVEPATRRQPEHFGYMDGLSQPLINERPAPSNSWSLDVPLGDVLLGHPNRFDFPRPDPLLDNGSYLVVRKLRQDVEFFHEHLEQESQRLGISSAKLKAKMMGRTLEGEILANPQAPTSNDFNYDGDPKGLLCPFAAHARRANPRLWDTPRIVRRGMSYGPPFNAAQPTPGERGLMFLAYNARIAEQFEVIQRWMSGGNSSGVYSGESDPLLGVPELNDARIFRFQDTENGQSKLLHARLTDATTRPFVTLDWGMYLFVPSMTGLRTLIGLARRVRDVPDDAAGEQILQRLLQLDRELGARAIDHWKAVLEDAESHATGTAANVWAAIRERHDGVLRTSFGVLVCSRELVMEVFANNRQRYSATGYLKRMQTSLGQIYLGKDRGAEYKREAKATNAAIQSITGEAAFNSAYRYTVAALRELIAVTRRLSQEAQLRSWELTLDLKELSDIVLAKLSHEWFDVPDGKHILAGGWRWDWDPQEPPLCPGHFTAPSRFTFQPHPGETPRHYGRQHGKALRAAMNKFVKERRQQPESLQGRLSQAMFKALPAAKDNDLLARNLVGVLMGFLPSVDGNLRATLHEWIEHRTLWEVQQAYSGNASKVKYHQAMATILQPLMNTMRLRPVPEMVWRTATVRHRLGNVELRPKDLVVVAIVSATQQDRVKGNVRDVFPIFGGTRDGTTDRPHACPAYDSGLGILLGIIAGLLDSGPLRPTPAPLTLNFGGEL